MTDPTPFLATIASSSAALVAIIGGLLVAKFVTLDSEQQGAQHLLDDAMERLSKAEDRAQESKKELHRQDFGDFFSRAVLVKIYTGIHDVTELKDTRAPGSLMDEDIAEGVSVYSKEFSKAREMLSKVIDPAARRSDVGEWEDLKAATPALQDVKLDDAWRIALDNHFTKKQHGGQFSNSDFSFLAAPQSKELFLLLAQRRDALISDIDQCNRKVEDLRLEVAQLKRKRDSIVRPKGLGVGLIILSLFTAGGVIYPIEIMAHAPKYLTRGTTHPVFGAFTGGLVLLLGYMGWLSLRLSGRFRRDRSEQG